MRRFRRPAVTVSKRRVILFRLFLAFCAVFAVFSVLDNRLRPVITTMAQYQCRVVSVLAMNEAVMEELNEVQDIEQALVEVDKAPDGTVSAIEINSVEVNRLKTRLTDAVANRLLSVPKQDVRVPLGTLLGWQIMAGRGPDIPLQVVPASFVQSTIVDTLETAGINQTQHRIFIRFTVEMSAILPGYSTSVTVENEVCIAQTLIVGKVPQFYASGS